MQTDCTSAFLSQKVSGHSHRHNRLCEILLSSSLIIIVLTGRSAEEKDSFWDQMISVTGSIPASELIVVGGDLNGHVGTNIDGYDGVHGGYGFGKRNADGERILESCDAMELIVTNTCFKRQKKQIGHLCIWWHRECS